MSASRTAPPRRPPGLAEIFRAVPAGSGRARSQRAYLTALLADPELADLRGDARRTVLEVARILARHASWHTRTTWRPRAYLCAEVGSSRDPSRPLSVSAYKAARRWLERHGYLGTVEGGSTPAFRPGVLVSPDDGNRCPLYVLAVPRRHHRQLPAPGCGPALNRPLAWSRRDLAKALRAREVHPEVKTRTDRAPRGQTVLPRSGPALHSCPRTRAEGLGAALVIQGRSRDLRRISPEHVRSIARPYFERGWSALDLVFALDHEPGGRQHGYTHAVRSPARWAAARLAEWLGPDGLPVASRSQRRAADRERTRAEQERLRAERRQPAPSVAEAGAALARQLLAARLAELQGRTVAHVRDIPGRAR